MIRYCPEKSKVLEKCQGAQILVQLFGHSHTFTSLKHGTCTKFSKLVPTKVANPGKIAPVQNTEQFFEYFIHFQSPK
jgi:predicted phosphodiesterase